MAMNPFLKNLLIPLFAPLRILFFIISAIPLLALIVLFFAFENTAITNKNWALNIVEIQRAKNIVSNTHLKEQNKTLLTEKDLNIALSYLLNYYITSTSQVKINNNQLNLKVSLLIPKSPSGKFLNFSFNLSKHDGYPIINTLQIGSIIIANEFAGLMVENIIKYTSLKDFYILIAQHIRSLDIQKKGLSISYITSDDLRLKTALNLGNKNYNSILFYQQNITSIIAKHNPKWKLSLAELLQPLFLKAFQRSTIDTAISENRAVLIAISTYVNKNEIQTLIPFDIGPFTKKQYTTSLYTRADMAKHFMISAVLASAGAETFAGYIGQEKELIDAKEGSGFSFIDLAGDHAGLRFGRTAIESPTQARRLQKRMSTIEDYTAFMPEVRDLPESMSDISFKQRFTSIYSVKYQHMLEKIDKRISQLPLYQ